MLLLEINEFNPDLMQQAAEELGAKNLQKLLNLRCSGTITDDQKERFGLDPWVQWVSIHTGKTSGQHGVKHLGDVPQLQHAQLWETLNSRGIRCGVWGAMNASKGETSQCEFFFPDPWTFSEVAYPSELNNLLALPRYFSKNYGDLNKVKLLQGFARLIWFCLNPRIAFCLLPLLPRLVTTVLKHGMHEYLLFVLFDLVNARLFAHYYKRTKPQFAILFLNSLAHLQHHKWTSKKCLSREMQVAFNIFDEALGIIFNTISPDDQLIVANAFTQFCSFDDNEYLYRQKNPEEFLKTAGIKFLHVEQAMTNDGHVFFDNPENAATAAKALEQATVNGKLAFHVESGGKTPDKIFFQVIVWEPLKPDAIIDINNRQLKFFDQFEVITRRSGSHLQQGHAFSKNIELPEKLYNHEIHDYILKTFKAA